MWTSNVSCCFVVVVVAVVVVVVLSEICMTKKGSIPFSVFESSHSDYNLVSKLISDNSSIITQSSCLLMLVLWPLNMLTLKVLKD